MFSSTFFQVGKPAPSQAKIELIAELRAIASRTPKAPAKPNKMTVAEVKRIASRKPVAPKGNIKLTRDQIDSLYRKTFKGQPFAHGRCIAIR